MKQLKKLLSDKITLNEKNSVFLEINAIKRFFLTDYM